MSERQSKRTTTTVAFFDFDGTLTTGDTLMPFLKYVVGTPRYYGHLALLSPVILAYFAKLIRNDIVKSIVLREYLRGYYIDELCDMGGRFSREFVPKMCRPEGINLVRWHQSQGHECVLVSASLDVYLKHWARQMGFNDVLCTALETTSEGRITGSLKGENCYGGEKVRRIQSWCSNQGFSQSYAYGDAPGDLPMVLAVSNGYLWSARERAFKLHK